MFGCLGDLTKTPKMIFMRDMPVFDFRAVLIGKTGEFDPDNCQGQNSVPSQKILKSHSINADP